MLFKAFLEKITTANKDDTTLADKEAVEVIHSIAPADIFQVIFDRGHSVGLKKGKEDGTEVTGKLAVEKKRADDAEQQLKDFKDKNPDKASLQEKYQTDLATKDREHTEALRLKDVQIETERKRRARSEFIAELKDLDIDPEYAEVIADKKEHNERIRFDANGEPEVLQRGKEIAIVPTAKKGALGMLAAELLPSIPAKWITSNAGGGGGQQEERGGGSGGDKKKVLQNVRQKELDRQKGLRPTSSASDRLSGRAARRRSEEDTAAKK